MPGCKQGWEQNGTHCYFWNEKAMTWPEAEDYCRNQSGHLASVTSHAINDYIVKGKNKRGLNRLWFGGSDLEAEGTWRWTDCSPWEFEFWKSGEPNNNWGAQDCLNFYPTWEAAWDDQRCKNSAPFLCSQAICSGESEKEWEAGSSTMFAGSGASILVLLLIVLAVLLCVFKRRRIKRNAVDVAHADENPVYGTYFDPDPRAEVDDNKTY